jgi:hypothetical protein
MAPHPRVTKTEPTAVAVVPQFSAISDSVDPRATSTMPHTPMASR